MAIDGRLRCLRGLDTLDCGVPATGSAGHGITSAFSVTKVDAG
jgi:hypothetical protein